MPRYPLPLSALRPELARVVAEAYLKAGSWDVARVEVLASNALQARSHASGVRLEREHRIRLSTLTVRQLRLLAGSHSEDRAAMAWLAVARHSPFVFEFASEVLRAKLQAHDTVLRLSDYEDYVRQKGIPHPELNKLAASSRAKLRQVLICMLKEAGILGKGPDLGQIHRPVLSPDATRATADDDPGWLAAFLVSPREGKAR